MGFKVKQTALDLWGNREEKNIAGEKRVLFKTYCIGMVTVIIRETGDDQEFSLVYFSSQCKTNSIITQQKMFSFDFHNYSM